MDFQKLISHLPIDTSPLSVGECMEILLVGNDHPPGADWKLVMAGKFNALWYRSTLRPE